MRRVYDSELKRIQLDILDNVAEFCEKNGIKYWLDSGTLIGAIRHKGYIPWDDDIDIGMLRPDFDKFMALFNESNDKYKSYCIDNNPEFYYAHGKVLDTDTVLYEPDKNGLKLCINIDIFVYDNTPDERICNKMYNIRDRYRGLHILRVFDKGTPRGGVLRKMAIRIGRVAVKMFPKNYFITKMSENSKRYSKIDTQYVGNFTAFSRMICDKSVFASFIKGEFEGKEYMIPVGYDKWLRSFYGDYMQLPPEEKRVSHHKFEAYVKDNEE